MALFGKKQSKEDRDLLKRQQQDQLKFQQEEQKKMLAPFEVHVMPAKFSAATAAAIGSSAPKKSRAGLLILIVLIILAALGVGAYQLYRSLNQPLPIANLPAPIVNQPVNNQPAPTVNAPVNNTPANNEPVNNVPVNNAPVNNVPVNNAPVNNAPPVNEPINNANTNTAEPVTVQYQSSVDTDRDGLTDTEEDLFTTQVRLPDTDGDGYTDGQEIINLYSPLSSGPVLLRNTALVNVYTDEALGFEMLYPSSWLAKPTDQSRLEVLFTSATGESMQLQIKDNAVGDSLASWITKNYPGQNPNEMTAYTNHSSISGLISLNGLVYYLDVPSQKKVYVFSYLPGSVTKLNFQTTEKMMVNSITPR